MTAHTPALRAEAPAQRRILSLKHLWERVEMTSGEDEGGVKVEGKSALRVFAEYLT